MALRLKKDKKKRARWKKIKASAKNRNAHFTAKYVKFRQGKCRHGNFTNYLLPCRRGMWGSVMNPIPVGFLTNAT